MTEIQFIYFDALNHFLCSQNCSPHTRENISYVNKNNGIPVLKLFAFPARYLHKTAHKWNRSSKRGKSEV